MGVVLDGDSDGLSGGCAKWAENVLSGTSVVSACAVGLSGSAIGRVMLGRVALGGEVLGGEVLGGEVLGGVMFDRWVGLGEVGFCLV